MAYCFQTGICLPAGGSPAGKQHTSTVETQSILNPHFSICPEGKCGRAARAPSKCLSEKDYTNKQAGILFRIPALYRL